MNAVRTWLGWPLVVVAAVSCASCGSGGGQVPVQGKVTHKGQPLAGATVTFVPEDRGAGEVDWPIGTTAEDGSFSVKSGAVEGAAPGKYKVTIVCNVAPKSAPKGMAMGGFETEDMLKGMYANADSSKLTVEVTPGMEPLKPFELK